MLPRGSSSRTHAAVTDEIGDSENVSAESAAHRDTENIANGREAEMSTTPPLLATQPDSNELPQLLPGMLATDAERRDDDDGDAGEL